MTTLIDNTQQGCNALQRIVKTFPFNIVLIAIPKLEIIEKDYQ